MRLVRSLTRPARRRALSADLTLFVGARLMSFTGNAISPIALSFALLDRGASGATVGVLVAMRFAAQVSLLLFAGVIADRVPRKATMAAANFAAFGSQLLIATLLAFSPSVHLGLLLVLQSANGASAALFYPSSAGAAATLVGSDVRQRLNAWLQAATQGGLLLGSALASGLLAAAGSAATLYAGGTAFLLSGLMVIAIDASMRVPGGAARGTLLAELRQGWDAVVARRWIVTAMIQFSIVNMVNVSGCTILGPMLFHDDAGGPASWAAIVTAQSTGLVLGSFVAMRVPAHRPMVIGEACVLLVPLPLLLLGLHAGLPAVLAGAFAGGVGMSVFTTMWNVAIQTDVPNRVVARVSAYDQVFSCTSVPLGAALAGPAGQMVGIRPTLLAGAALSMVATGAALASSGVRGLRLHLGEPPVVPEVPPKTLTVAKLGEP